MTFKSGFVAIIGRPNVGKSTLSNSFAGEKISIVSSKPQTTRNTVRAIVSSEDSQIIFIDTPGMHSPKNKLGEHMVANAQKALYGVDAVLFVTEATDGKPGPGDRYIMEQLSGLSVPIFLIINKIDLVEKEKIFSLISQYSSIMEFDAVIPVSALLGEGTDIILKEIKNLLPEGPEYFPKEMITDQPEKIIAAELIREKILELAYEEVPHATGVEVISSKERSNGRIIDIEANIYCEKETHKGILIGKGGQMLKKVATQARIDIELLLGVKVFLQVWVKVKPGWKNSDSMLKTMGYK